MCIQAIKDIALIAAISLVLDAVFLGSMTGYFKEQVRRVQGSDMQMNYLATGLVYVAIVGMIYKFLVLRKDATVWDAALLGWSTYLIYELTNKAIFTKWSWTTVLLDGFWGGILYAATFYLFRKITVGRN